MSYKMVTMVYKSISKTSLSTDFPSYKTPELRAPMSFLGLAGLVMSFLVSSLVERSTKTIIDVGNPGRRFPFCGALISME